MLLAVGVCAVENKRPRERGFRQGERVAGTVGVEQQHRGVDAAIGRLENGGYGICVSCGCDIPEERLLATPTVQTCIQCQERIEQEEGTGRGPTM